MPNIVNRMVTAELEHEFAGDLTVTITDVAGNTFHSSGIVIVDPGWSAVDAMRRHRVEKQARAEQAVTDPQLGTLTTTTFELPTIDDYFDHDKRQKSAI